MVLKQVDYWDEYAPAWGEKTRMDLYSDFNLEKTLRSLPLRGRQLRILDLGTGAGLVAVQAALLGHTAVGLDNSPQMLKQARLTAKWFSTRIMLINEDAHYVRAPKGMFDVIIAKDLLMCLEDPYGAIKRWKELLNPGGFLIIVDGNYLFYLHNETFKSRRDALMAEYQTDDLQQLLGPGKNSADFKEIVASYTANKVRRPSWELWYLSGLGFENFTINYIDTYDKAIPTKEGALKIPCRYIISANVREDRAHANTSPKSNDPEDIQLNVMKALGNNTRVEIIKLLEMEDYSASDICNRLNLAPNDASYHLKILKDADIVVGRRYGRNIIYSLNDTRHINSLLNTMYLMKNDSSLNH